MSNSKLWLDNDDFAIEKKQDTTLSEEFSTALTYNSIPLLIEEEQAMLLTAFPFTNDEETGEPGTGPVNRRLAFEYSQQVTPYEAEALVRFGKLVLHYIAVADKA